MDTIEPCETAAPFARPTSLPAAETSNSNNNSSNATTTSSNSNNNTPANGSNSSISNSSISNSSRDSIWIEKYRPQTLDDVGPPGTGKTSSVLCLARQLLQNKWRNSCLELNASDERSIDVVRDRIKGFAKEKRDLPPGRHKIALRRIMEQHSDTTRFALACNSSTSVIEPLQSRCAILRFTKLADAHLVQRLREVCAKENVTFTDDGIEAIVFSADGDMRSALNNLQSTVSGFGLVDKANVEKVCDTPPPEMLRRILQLCVAGDWYGAQSVARVILGLGYTPLDVVTTLRGVLRRSDGELQEHLLLEFLGIVGLAHMTMAGGLCTELQME
ncbi:replication factor c subunit, putative [Eimeria maxima]|uniref:Replication factor c subunit, putative n=1 Tax=Eimeria maxima TaxID=5804 RepID=U6MF84_EIMMA|nr:replication factor c subunit, putative [Eimeria maxima]CDJ60325.1 replication factor c subunit, putative [Eimeria maxima]